MAYQITPHTADVCLEVTAKSWGELLTEAVAGLMKIMEPKGKGEAVSRKISLTAGDTTSLLVDFLNQVLTSAQIHREQYDSVELEKLTETEVVASLTGFGVGGFSTDVKAVTYHLAEVKKENGKWSVSLVLDV